MLKSSIHIIVFSKEKAVLSESEEKYAQIKLCLQAKTDFDVRRRQEKTLQWRKHYYGLWSCILPRGKLKTFKDLFLTKMQRFTINWWTGVVWIIVMFLSAVGLSFWRHPFTADDPLVRYWYNAKFIQIWWRKKHIYTFDGLRGSTFKAN